jgi:single-stranded DNA-binding protein
MTNDEQLSMDVNRVELSGRLAAKIEARILPSGTELSIFRVTVRRAAGDRVRVDSIDCEAERPAARRTLARAEPGDRVELTGVLQRRFWRGAGGLQSRYSVRADSVKLRPGRRGAASRARKQVSA